MSSPVRIVLWTFILHVFAIIHAQSLPYNPTTILRPRTSSKEQDLAYVFLQSSGSHQLASLNISSTISQSNLSLETVTSILPFLTDDSIAFIPTISSADEISVYAGSCSTNQSSALWRFTPANISAGGSGTWEQETTWTASDVTSAALPGADFLSKAFSFSTIVDTNASQSNIYIFGGMCPTSSATTSTWQSSASYSNQMLRLEPSISSSTSSTSRTSYTLDITSDRGAPIAEAGFTITGLAPTYSNVSGIMTQAQNYVLLGGHTQTAFINMSQVALWSLPEEIWSFVTVDSPSTSNGNTELAIKSAVTSVDSRSGHTAVLSEDGSQVIVFGGWVGDVSQAAVPQLAILSLGTGFGGQGDWQWEIPSQQPSGSGLYGHGALMLPGNVMMILGGYNISASSSSKRATTSATSAMFFNATSMQWVSNYTNPAYVAAIAVNTGGSSSSNSNSTRVGLGVGLGLGLAAVIGALIVFFWYNRRLKRKRKEARENDIRDLSMGASNFYTPRSEMGERRGAFPWSNGGWNGGNANEPVYDSTSAVAGYENLQIGVHDFGDTSVPQPPRQIPRKPLHSRNARGMYQPTPTFDPKPATSHGRGSNLGTAGPIHPIYEADEEDHIQYNAEDVGVAIGEPTSRDPSPERNRYSDPFKDPSAGNPTALRTQGRNVVTPDAESIAHSREREIQEWVSDWAAADILLNSQMKTHSNAGRISPTRRAQLIAASHAGSVSGEDDSGRTASNLSERSVAISGFSVSRSGSSSQGRSRSNSLRGFITGMNPFTTTILSTTVGSTNVSPVFDGPGPHGPRNPPRSAGSTSETSFNTAHTSFQALQEQGESLLPRPGEHLLTRDYSPTRSQPESQPGSPSKSKPTINLGKGRSQGWLGSLRRVFATSSGNTSPASPNYSSRDDSPVRPIDYSAMSSGGVEPRRTVSAGATLWRRKQGKTDWQDSADNNDILQSTGRSNTFTASLPRGMEMPREAGDASDDEWDIERAVENRVVQVMFTVPKEKLRVVNHDFEEEKSEVGSVRQSSLRSKGSGRRSAASEPLLEDIDEKEEWRREVRQSPRPKEKGKGKVLEIVEKIEGRSPEHSPTRS
ncbi:hypothetical protein L207DRAFT_418686 [Hyaloscypha variabilis F]|uniref:Galactose oxidase n=1 Tax=Hyaloscypha variabilis (strain UAMH 11265 / GT02V1 / F) TaxID=1149755 RepID=A0A2J6S753_HYAVF|nr:hypothetical protein L207DRAFT_418686 [Hyaloscypha variabilis F]